MSERKTVDTDECYVLARIWLCEVRVENDLVGIPIISDNAGVAVWAL